MNKKLKTALFLALIILITAALAVILYFTQRVTMNPDGTVGNTAGNLNNSGLFCEYNGTVYFSNTSDGGSLCAMDPNEGNVRRLSTLKVKNILAGGDYLYYFQQGTISTQTSAFNQLPGIRSFDRCKLNGTGGTSLTSDVVVTGQLVNNYLYLLANSNGRLTFYKLKIDKSEQVELADYIINPACAVDGIIYYNGTGNNHYLYALNTATDVSNEFWRGNLWNPVREGDYVYYLDVANDYRLCRYSISMDVIEVLTEDRVDCFNVGSGYVYYQKNSAEEPQLKFMSVSGGEAYVLAQGNYTNINMTSQYVYFQAFGDETTMYHAPLGSGSYGVFSPAL